jgi:hypothetical protein
MNKVCIPVLWGLSCLLASCDSTSISGADGHGQAAAKRHLPEPIREAVNRDVGAVCVLESINGRSPRAGARFAPGATAVFRGWARTADGQMPLPPVVYLRLRPQGADPAQVTFLELGRMPRADIAGEESALEMIGFEGLGRLPEAEGTYEVDISQGTSAWQTLCRSPTLLTVAAAREPGRRLLPVVQDHTPSADSDDANRGQP